MFKVGVIDWAQGIDLGIFILCVFMYTWEESKGISWYCYSIL